MMMGNLKIVFAGPTGAGKTTAVTAVSDVPVVTTDELATDMTQARKPKTTVALDFGITTLGGLEPIHIYGAPGQERFSFMWDILTEGGSGLVLLADNSRPNPIKDLLFYLETFKHYITDTKLAIGITRSDVNPHGPSVSEYRRAITNAGFSPPIMYVDARNKEDVTLLVKALMSSMSPVIHRPEPVTYSDNDLAFPAVSQMF